MDRKSLRLQNYDYTRSGAYFVTVIAYKRAHLFGEIVNKKIILNTLGEIVREEILKTEKIRTEIHMDTWIVMPNHIHFIVFIQNTSGLSYSNSNVRAHGRAPLHRPARSLPSLIAGFKSACTKRINLLHNTPGKKIWQRNYYNHVIRNEKSLFEIRKYIQQNPINWEIDPYHPKNLNKRGIHVS